MATIYRKGRDKGKRNAPYYIEYFDHTGKRRSVKGPSDRRQAEMLAAKLENDVLLRRRGIIDPKQEELAERRSSPIEEQLLEFEKSLRRRKRTGKHLRLTMSRLRRVIAGCGFELLGDINADAVDLFIDEFCDENNLGPKTFNHYCQAFEQFCQWLTKRGLVASNPVPGLPRRNCEVDVRKKRRALTPEEFGKLVESARNSGKFIQEFDGETRARIYLLSYLTGLRRSELASLTPSSFDLDSEQPMLTIEATISKHRRTDRLPLHPQLVEMLRHWLKGLEPNQPLFPKLKNRRTWLMVKLDLERAGIPYRTPEGDADFHAAGRHTHITQLIRSGASLSEAKELARHSDIQMTTRYTHIGLADQAKALAALPVPCQHIVSNPGVAEVLSGSQPVAGVQPNGADGNDVKSCNSATSDASKQEGASDDSDAPKWRRRELHPRPEIRL